MSARLILEVSRMCFFPTEYCHAVLKWRRMFWMQHRRLSRLYLAVLPSAASHHYYHISLPLPNP